MNFSQRFNQEELSDVILRLRSTLNDPDLLDEASRKRARPEEGGPSIERSYFLHKVILFQSPYFEKLHKWARDQAAALTSIGKKPLGG